MKRSLIVASAAIVSVIGCTSVVGSAATLTVDGGTVQVFQFAVTPPELPDVPAECAEILAMTGVTVSYGSPGHDVFHGENHPQVYMGLDGDDTIYGGNQSDCLVGGPGIDSIHGETAKDVLLGGAGNDHLDGGNGKDEIDGGEGDSDVCVGGQGEDEIVNCEA